MVCADFLKSYPRSGEIFTLVYKFFYPSAVVISLLIKQVKLAPVPRQGLNSDAVFRLDAAVHKAVINTARVNASHSAARINKSNFHKTNLLFLQLLELYIIPKTKSTEF